MEKFMKKMWKKSEGFTLVELIVVIAILGILAAVAVPAYSGYITKANQAADDQVVTAVQTAFSAACALYGEDPEDYSGTVNFTDGTIEVGTTEVAGNIETSFEELFEGNEVTALKVYSSIGITDGVAAGAE